MNGYHTDRAAPPKAVNRAPFTADLLHETAQHHDHFEKASPPHNWWDWYAAYLSAREQGSTPEEADAAADRYMAEVKHVVATRA